jgi:hypothetical protein
MIATTEMREAIEGLYGAFACHPLPDVIETCTCCNDPADFNRTLHAKPLRLLTAGNLRSYLCNVLLTAGSDADFKHFLPRLFEIAIFEVWNHPDPPMLLDRLRRACWEHWPQVERRSFKRALRADVVAEAWATLYRTESRPFKRPTTGKIAIKVINHYGDEVLKAYAVDRQGQWA